jgi:AcrR family transcriptional regulator
MTAATDRRVERHAAKRAAILTEAWTLARRDGLAAISLRDLAGAVGLRQPSLYVYFESKADLYDAMFADGYRQLLAAIPPERYPGEPGQALATLIGDCIRFSSEDVVRHQLLFQRTIPGFEPSPQSMALAVEFYELGRRLLVAAGAGRQADMDVFSGLVSGFAHQQIANDPGGKRWVRLAGRATEMFLADVERRRRPSGSGGGR